MAYPPSLLQNSPQQALYFPSSDVVNFEEPVFAPPPTSDTSLDALLAAAGREWASQGRAASPEAANEQAEHTHQQQQQQQQQQQWCPDNTSLSDVATGVEQEDELGLLALNVELIPHDLDVDAFLNLPGDEEGYPALPSLPPSPVPAFVSALPQASSFNTAEDAPTLDVAAGFLNPQNNKAADPLLPSPSPSPTTTLLSAPPAAPSFNIAGDAADLDPTACFHLPEGAVVGMILPSPSPSPITALGPQPPRVLPPPPAAVPLPAPSFDIAEDATAEPPRKRSRKVTAPKTTQTVRVTGPNILSSAAPGNPRLPVPFLAPTMAVNQAPMVPDMSGYIQYPELMGIPPLLPSHSEPASNQWPQLQGWQQMPQMAQMPQAGQGSGWIGDLQLEGQAGWFMPSQIQMPIFPYTHPPPPSFLQAQAQAQQAAQTQLLQAQLQAQAQAQAQVQGQQVPAAPQAQPQFQPTRKRGRGGNKPRATGQGRRNDLY